jgi:ferrochelatase
MDRRVIDLAAPLRWLLVHLLVAPFRGPRSARAYAAIWTEQGSPLLVHGRALRQALADALPDRRVALGMRYGHPTIAAALDELGPVDELVVLPLYPQYASSSAGSALEAIYAELARREHVPSVRAVPPFWRDAGWLDAQAALGRDAVASADHVLFSYHSIPVRHVERAAPAGTPCARTDACCAAVPPWCYRAQCLDTTRRLAERLGLPRDRVTTSFQSRLGRDEWLGPSTVDTLRALGARGGTLAVFTPSFAADNLETIEEIGLEGARTFTAAGGRALLRVPCVNAEPAWVAAAARLAGGSDDDA